jgi:hypothetical protein
MNRTVIFNVFVGLLCLAGALMDIAIKARLGSIVFMFTLAVLNFTMAVVNYDREKPQ